MAKKKLTVIQQRNRYKAIQYSTFGGEFLSIFTPYIALGIANADEWFANDQGWKIGLGGSLALALLGIAIFLVTKKKEDDKLTNGYITLIVGWFAVAFIFVLLANIMDQIATIMLFGGIGLCGAFGLDLVSKNAKAKAEKYDAIIKKVKDKKLEQKVEEELIQESNDVEF